MPLHPLRDVDPKFSLTLSFTGLGVASACGRPWTLVEHHLRGERQPRWLIPTKSHWSQWDMAVCIFFISPLNFDLTIQSSIYRPPPISFNNTDTLMLYATNSIDQMTTLHHHGLFFNSTSWMDGVLGVTQWYVICGPHNPPATAITLNIHMISVTVVSRRVEISLTKSLSTNSGEPTGSIPMRK